ncbi:MAG: ATP-binding cassette domain-containing protein [Bacteroidales bacterium]
MKKILEIKDLSAGYGDEVVLRDINLVVYDHDFIGIIGPNGGGKTTLLKVILGLIKPYRGTVKFFNDRQKNPNNIIGYLPQINQIDLRFPISVIDVVLSGLMSKEGVFSRYSGNRKKLAGDLLKQLGIYGLRKKTIGELSGGQLQRVYLCRAIISSPRMLMLDEPNTFVDTKFETDFYEILKDLNNEMAIIVVSHDVGTISWYVKTIACVNRKLHYHPTNIITQEQLASYNCPIQIITHGDVPHTVLKIHNH